MSFYMSSMAKFSHKAGRTAQPNMGIFTLDL